MSFENGRINDPQLAEAMARDSHKTRSKAAKARAESKLVKSEETREILRAFEEGYDRDAERLENLRVYKHNIEKQAEKLSEDELKVLIEATQKDVDLAESEFDKFKADHDKLVEELGTDEYFEKFHVNAERIKMKRAKLEALLFVFHNKFESRMDQKISPTKE